MNSVQSSDSSTPSNNVILLVEDNPSDIDFTRRVLEEHRIVNELVVAEDGQQALHYLYGTGLYTGRDPHVAPTVILLDLTLPHVDGLEVLRRLRADEGTRLIPVVILTTSNEERGLVESCRLGANSYVCKPVDFSQFVEAIRELGLFWLALNEPPSPKK